MRRPRLFGLLLGAAALAGCSLLPTAGPSLRDIEAQEPKGGPPRFALIEIDARSVAALRAVPVEDFKERFAKFGLPPKPTIGVGDTVAVAIWEAAAGGLFASAPGDAPAAGAHSIALPEQVVDADGAITVPFAGRIAVDGLEPAQVQQAIAHRLADKAIDPQVIVRVVKSVANTATVTGEVQGGGRMPLSPKGDRLLEVIAAAGGARAPVYETFVRLSRRGVTATMPMQTLVSEPAENIYAWPGDVMTLVRAPKSFSVFGAAGTNAEVNFGSDRMNLAEALAKAGGLQDARSDPAGVFLFRHERPEAVRALGPRAAGPVPDPDDSVPVVYRLDLTKPDSYFLAQDFPVEDKDLIYVANARFTELQKFFGLLSTLTSPVITGVVVKDAVH
ncbi:MAG TPA: polysaccharide biosynthesis/export family protein [Stellaceae bacterium]|nr:polysaccharide biosynthesis/export family protein [Stellaceae bacterium]